MLLFAMSTRRLFTLLTILSLSAWTIGCGQPATGELGEVVPATDEDDEAGSTTDGAAEVPVAPADGDSDAEPTGDSEAAPTLDSEPEQKVETE